MKKISGVSVVTSTNNQLQGMARYTAPASQALDSCSSGNQRRSASTIPKAITLVTISVRLRSTSGCSLIWRSTASSQPTMGG